MLGLTLWSINFLQAGHDLLGAIAFVLSLGFKQMALYYAPAMFELRWSPLPSPR